MRGHAVVMPEITTKFDASSLKIPGVVVSTWQHRGLVGNLFLQLGQGWVRSQPGTSYSRGWSLGVNLPVLPAKSESLSVV